MAGLRRANGEYSGVNPAVSCCRLRQIQSLLRDHGAKTPDGILCTLGIESSYNEGCRELAKYLFYGLYEKNPLNLDLQLMLDGRSGSLFLFDDFALINPFLFTDVILLIKSECVHLYCTPMNYSYLLPYVSHWRNLHLYCMTEAESEDHEEAAEEFKISSFVKMVEGCVSIGVPFSSFCHIQKFDMFMVEKWPLIKAFALDGIGGGSFFTLKYKLMDMSERLWQVYSRLDPVSLDNLITEDLTHFEKQWSSFFSIMDQESHLSILELSEAQAGAAFRLYYSHGMSSSDMTDKSKEQKPFVLFGGHSSLEDLESHSCNFPSESHQVRNTGPRASAAKHMVLQCVSPKGPLACSRTYFFGTTHTPYLGIQTSNQKSTEVLLMSQIYSAVVEAVLAGIKCYAITLSAFKAKDVADHTFLSVLDSMNLSHYCNIIKSRCEFKIQAVNKQGRVVPLSDPKSRYLIKTASFIVPNIPDLQMGAGNLGSLVFSESFLESSINIQHKDGSVSTDSCFTILTSTVPRYACWLLEADVKQSEQARHLTKKKEGSFLGSVLTQPDTAYVFTNNQLCTPDEGKIIFFSGGILFGHPQSGCFTLSSEHISSIKFYHPDSNAVASLLVEYESTLLPYLPFPLHSSDLCLVFALQPGSRSLSGFYSTVLPVWRNSESGLVIETVDQEQLISTQINMHTRLQKLHNSQEPPVAKRVPSLKSFYSRLPEQDMFLQHFSLSSIGEEAILFDHLGALFPSTEFTNSVSINTKIVITIIAGLPGSHKERLYNSVVQLHKDSGPLVLYEPTMSSFSASDLHQFVSRTLNNLRGAEDKTRMLVLSPGCTDVLDVVQAVLFHPDPAIQASVKIGAVTACVDPLSSFLEHRFAFPKLLEQCSQGIVSTVVFTGLTAERKHPLLQHVQQLVRTANPSAACIQAERGAVWRSEEMNQILSDSSFNEPQMLRARYVLYPGWCKGQFFTGSGSPFLTQQHVAFKRPLERPLFVARCKALKPSVGLSSVPGNVYTICGKVKFSDTDQMTQVTYNTVSGNMTIVPDLSTDTVTPGPQTDKTSCFLIFYGVGLTEDGLKDWLRLCAKQRPSKKPRKTKNNLSPEEMKNIYLSQHQAYSFNCYQYGHKTNMDDLIEEYLTEANKEIELFNQQLELQDQPDLFDL
ncbi:uncharacterized protein C20orf194 homolog isoform X1 [Synchiropus splendidus]|uniref:uncharacterized protein C20orf194 homolog isoform X1 n=2 Tax=Synchiropus splendidus TaxID=270530 RepID=UPI00237E5386|nr:uncharacterized protein C20orf194 homolog isoform X1 [Synchiropus splendidus]